MYLLIFYVLMAMFRGQLHMHIKELMLKLYTPEFWPTDLSSTQIVPHRLRHVQCAPNRDMYHLSEIQTFDLSKLFLDDIGPGKPLPVCWVTGWSYHNKSH